MLTVLIVCSTVIALASIFTSVAMLSLNRRGAMRVLLMGLGLAALSTVLPHVARSAQGHLPLLVSVLTAICALLVLAALISALSHLRGSGVRTEIRDLIEMWRSEHRAASVKSEP